MEKFATYLAAVDGTNDWATVKPLYDDAFDADCVFVTADGEHDKASWSVMVQGLLERRAVASDFEITHQDGDLVYYQLTVTVPGEEPLHTKARGTLKDGRLVRVEPLEPEQYSTMVEMAARGQ